MIEATPVSSESKPQDAETASVGESGVSSQHCSECHTSIPRLASGMLDPPLCTLCAFRGMDPFKPVPQDGVLLLVTDLQERLVAETHTEEIVAEDDDDADNCPITQSEPLLALELNLPDLRQLRKEGQEVELRMLRARALGQSCDEDRVETEQLQPHRLHQAWPRFLNLEINGRQVFTVKPPKRTQKRRDVPQPISPNLKPGANEIKIRINDECPDDFVLAAVRCLPVAPRELAKFARRISYEDSFKRVQLLLRERPRGEAEGSDGITCVGDEKLQLRCPITLVRPALPSRGAACRHFQCFDLEAYLVANYRTRAFNNRWRCPLCDLELRPRDLRVDGFVESVLKETQEVDEEVWLANDGSWRESDHPAEIEQDGDSSDDAAAEAAVAAATHSQKSTPSAPKGPCVIEEDLEDREEEKRIARRMRMEKASNLRMEKASNKEPILDAENSNSNKLTRKGKKHEDHEGGDARAQKRKHDDHEHGDTRAQKRKHEERDGDDTRAQKRKHEEHEGSDARAQKRKPEEHEHGDTRAHKRRHEEKEYGDQRKKHEEHEHGDSRAQKHRDRRRRHEGTQPDGIDSERNNRRHRWNDRGRGGYDRDRDTRPDGKDGDHTKRRSSVNDRGRGKHEAHSDGVGGDQNKRRSRGYDRGRGQHDGTGGEHNNRRSRGNDRGRGQFETGGRNGKGRGRGGAAGRGKGAAGAQVRLAKVPAASSKQAAAPKQAAVVATRIIRTRRPRNVPAPKGAIDLDSDAPPEEVSDDEIPPIENNCNALDIPVTEGNNSSEAVPGRAEVDSHSLTAGIEPGTLLE